MLVTRRVFIGNSPVDIMADIYFSFCVLFCFVLVGGGSCLFVLLKHCSGFITHYNINESHRDNYFSFFKKSPMSRYYITPYI